MLAGCTKMKFLSITSQTFSGQASIKTIFLLSPTVWQTQSNGKTVEWVSSFLLCAIKYGWETDGWSWFTNSPNQHTANTEGSTSYLSTRHQKNMTNELHDVPRMHTKCLCSIHMEFMCGVQNAHLASYQVVQNAVTMPSACLLFFWLPTIPLDWLYKRKFYDFSTK